MSTFSYKLSIGLQKRVGVGGKKGIFLKLARLILKKLDRFTINDYLGMKAEGG